MADWIQQNFPDIYAYSVLQGVNSWPDAIYAHST